MKFTRNGTTLNGDMEGAIGESCVLFTSKLDGIKEIVLDMSKVTMINSIGVKNWITWTLRIPKDCHVRILNCPYVIASQASTVIGFVTANFKIESFRAPFVCEKCNFEEIRTLTCGQEYDYPKNGLPAKIAVPSEQTCPKCRDGKLEPDFLMEKTFKFLR